MNDTELAALRKLAEDASPGPWRVGDNSDLCVLAVADNELIETEMPGTAAFIAAANPMIVLGLIDEIERLRSGAPGCPCHYIDPCDPQCSCANDAMSGGCGRCARYGSPEQRKAAAERIAHLLALATTRTETHSVSCAGCFFAGQHIDELRDLIDSAAPLGWAASNDMVGAGDWEKRAVELTRKWYGRGGRGPIPPEKGEPDSNHPGKIAELVPKFAADVWYYLRELLDGDQPWHVICHIQEHCKDFDAAVKVEFERLRAEDEVK